MEELTYEQKLKMANDYLDDITGGGLTWDCLPDINSLHHAETKEDVHELVEERLEDEGFPMELFDEDF